MQEKFPLKPLTEKEIDEVIRFFSNLEDLNVLEETAFHQIMFNYGRMRARGNRIEKAEQYLLRRQIKTEERYKEMKQREFETGLFDYPSRFALS
jgi:DNA polymerase III delta prime subunit